MNTQVINAMQCTKSNYKQGKRFGIEEANDLLSNAQVWCKSPKGETDSSAISTNQTTSSIVLFLQYEATDRWPYSTILMTTSVLLHPTQYLLYSSRRVSGGLIQLCRRPQGQGQTTLWPSWYWQTAGADWIPKPVRAISDDPFFIHWLNISGFCCCPISVITVFRISVF